MTNQEKAWHWRYHVPRIITYQQSGCWSWLGCNWPILPIFLSLSLLDFLQRRAKRVQPLLIDHTFVLFSYNRSILWASKHFCKGSAPVQKCFFYPCVSTCVMLVAQWAYCLVPTQDARKSQEHKCFQTFLKKKINWSNIRSI